MSVSAEYTNEILLSEIKSNAFDRADEHLNALQQDFERGTIKEQPLAKAMRAFFNYDKALVAPLERWVARHPTSYAASLARGTHLISEGHHQRGFSKAQLVEENQWQGMFDRFGVAYSELSRSLDLTAKPVLSHVEIMRLENVGGTLERAQSDYDRAVELHPPSLAARRQMIWLLRPEWHGGRTFEALDRYLADPSHQVLEADERQLLRADRYAAEAHWLNMFADRAADSLPSYNEAMRLDPENTFNFYGRGLALLRLNRNREALGDLEAAVREEPSDAFIFPLAICLLRLNIRDARARTLVETTAQQGGEGCRILLKYIKNPGWFNSNLKQALSVRL
jgi:tetratricopeptide (TPR) repeat protein